MKRKFAFVVIINTVPAHTLRGAYRALLRTVPAEWKPQVCMAIPEGEGPVPDGELVDIIRAQREASKEKA